MRVCYLMKPLRYILLLAALFGSPSPARSARPEKPRLVIVIVFDQFPFEYLERFRSEFHGGLATLLESGANFTNVNYLHAQCLTGPGHSVIMSGAYGDVSGIIANTWYDRSTKTLKYCVQDESVSLVGAKGNGRSPALYLTSSLGDALRSQTHDSAKVISLSNKDRAAILLGGRRPDAVYWMVDSAFVTSTFYGTHLPSWVTDFNHSGMINSYFGASWQSALPPSAFAKLDVDNAPYEEDRDGMGRTFPHPITGNDRSHITPSYYSALVTSPYGAKILAGFATQAMLNEDLGRRGTTDLLCVSFSSTDYVGHAYGPDSHEVLEMAVAMDKILMGFFTFVDSTVGLGHCLIAFTSDHGVAPIPEYIQAHSPGVDAGRVPEGYVHQAAEGILDRAYGDSGDGTWVEAVIDHNIYLRLPALLSRSISVNGAAQLLADSLRHVSHIAGTWNLLSHGGKKKGKLSAMVFRDYYPGRSGEVFYTLKPLYIEGGNSGTTHGDPYRYNTHVPMILMGSGIHPGIYRRASSPADLVPTLAHLLGITMTGGSTGRILAEALDSPFKNR